MLSTLSEITELVSDKLKTENLGSPAPESGSIKNGRRSEWLDLGEGGIEGNLKL